MKKQLIIRFAILTIIIVLTGLGINYYKQIYGFFMTSVKQNKQLPTVSPSDIQQATMSSSDLLQANALFEQNKFEESFSYYQRAIQSGNDLASAYSGLGNISMKWRRYDDAVGYYTASLKYGQNSTVLSTRCIAYRLLANYENANHDCNLSIQLNPNNVGGYEALAMLQLDEKNITAAQETINKALAINPNSADLHYAYAQIYTAQSDLENAIKELSNCINIDPNALNCYWDRGFDYYMNGEINQAKADMHSILDKGNPENDGELLYKAGNLLNMLGGNP
jgi:tetratricopeptide (TPR) repeat protein